MENMNTLWAKIKKGFERIENSRYSVFFFIFLFLLFVNIRNFLEVFSYETRHDLSVNILVHYNLFYAALAMTLILFFTLATRNDVFRVSKVILSIFFLVILPPILDLMISSGKGYNMSYLLPNVHSDLISRFFTFFGSMERPPGFQVLIGVTPGIKIEIAIVLVMSFVYIYQNNNRIFKSLIFTFLTYAILFFYSAVPFVLTGYHNLAKTTFNGNITEVAFTKFYLVIIFAIGTALLFLEKPSFLGAFSPAHLWVIVKDFRLTRFLYYFLIIILGVAINLSQGSILFPRDFFDIILAFFALAFAVIFSIITNNIADIDIDKISNTSRPLIRREIKIGDYLKLAWFFLALAILCSWLAGFMTLLFIALFILIYFVYSMPPLRLKRVTFFSKLAISLNSLILVVAGYEIIAGELGKFPFYIWPYFLIGITAAANFIDIKDYEGDKNAGIKTLPVVLGIKKAKILIGLFFIGVYLSFYWMLRGQLAGYNWLIFFLILGISQFFLINRKKYKEQPIFVVILFTLAIIILALAK